MHAKLMTMQGQTGKNSGYPYFDGTLKDYPKFRRRWHTFQDTYHKATPHRELVNLFRENCLEKKVADRLRSAETMAGCWRVLDPFYSDRFHSYRLEFMLLKFKHRSLMKR